METKVCTRCNRELPIENFKKAHYGRAGVCIECATKRRRENLARKKEEEARQKEKVNSAVQSRLLVLEQCTPRELMKELARRGYEGKLVYKQTIDICNF